MNQNSFETETAWKSLGLYLHIPFCVRKCAYCDFYSVPCEEELMERYCAALKRDLKACAAEAAMYSVNTIYIGGGTPSAFGEERLCELLRTIRMYYRIDAGCEVTVECNPDTTTPYLLHALRTAGVNRLSFGVQSARDSELQIIGRLHSFQGAQQALAISREVGFENVSLDLIFGLPGQDMSSWQNSVEALLSLQPEHLSCYALKVEEGTPLWQNRAQYKMADDDLQADMYLWMVGRLADAGYAQYEISNFARSGCESRHNLKYWLGEEYLGFGPAAYSFFEGRRFGNGRDLQGYLAGRNIREQDDSIGSLEYAQEYVMLRLRTVYGIGAQEYSELHKRDFAPLEMRLREFSKHGWTEKVNGNWRFTPEGFLISNPLIADLLEIQEENET